MKLWTAGEMIALRNFRRLDPPMKMAALCRVFSDHTRDGIMEAICASNRHERITAACDTVNHILLQQADGIPLINGKPASQVDPSARRLFTSYQPMF